MDIPADASSSSTATSSSRVAEQINELYRERHSCRAFLPTPVDAETIRAILATAQRTPSWCNVQPWRVVIASGESADAFRNALLQAADAAPESSDVAFPEEYVGVARERRRECGFALYESVGVARGDRVASARQTRENFRLFGAPHVAIICADATIGPYALVDCGAYVMSFVLAAASRGVATIPQASLASHSDVIRAQFGIADDLKVLCGVSFGYGDAAHPANGFRTSRAPLEDAVRFV